MNMVELLDKRAMVWEAAKAFLESKRDDSGIVSDEDTATYRKMEAKVTALTNQIELLEALQDKAKRSKIAAKIRECADVTDEIVRIIKLNISASQERK